MVQLDSTLQSSGTQLLDILRPESEDDQDEDQGLVGLEIDMDVEEPTQEHGSRVEEMQARLRQFEERVSLALALDVTRKIDSISHIHTPRN